MLRLRIALRVCPHHEVDLECLHTDIQLYERAYCVGILIGVPHQAVSSERFSKIVASQFKQFGRSWSSRILESTKFSRRFDDLYGCAD